MDGLLRALQSHLDVSQAEAQELMAVGQWLVAQCGRPDAAFSRLARRLNHLDPKAMRRFVPLLKKAMPAGALTPGQEDELADLARRYRLA
jgi:hypothetical protein